MTMREAKELYLKYDCSYFAMCMKDFTGYMEYRRVEVPKKHENHWRNKKASLLFKEVCQKKDYLSFYRLYKTVVVFWDKRHLHIILKALKIIGFPMKMRDRIGVAEIILGSNCRTRNKGMILWAGDLKETEIVVFLYIYVCKILKNASDSNIELERRIQRSRKILRKIEENL
ncbi:MAG: hypothetical protein J6A92_07300 [Lachnospiraceae bacterium]|nr:hypothetical protein [Lachnospiraceae bacterium]